MIRLGLCCIFRDEPIKFANTTATAIGRMDRQETLAKLARLCAANADSLLFCAGHGIVKDGALHGMIFFHGGDDSEFVARKKGGKKTKR